MYLTFFCLVNSFGQNSGNLHTLKSEKEFNDVTKTFKKRFEIFTTKKIKITKSFSDTLVMAQNWATKFGNSKQQLQSDFQVFFSYNQLIDNDKIIALGNELLANKEFLKLPESSYTAREILSAYYRKGYYRKQLELFPVFKELNKQHHYNVKDKTYVDYYEVAMIYYKLENYKLARENFTLQAEHFLTKKDLFRAGSMYNNIGLTYEKQYQYKKAVAFYKMSIKLLEKDTKKDIFYTADYKKHFKNIVASNIASIQIKSLKLEGLETVFFNELNSSKKLNEPRTIIQAFLNLAEINLLNKEFVKSNKYIDSALVNIKTYESSDLLSRAYALKSKYLLSQKKTKASFSYLLKSNTIKDSILNLQKQNNFKEASLEFNLDATKKELKFSKKIIEQKNKITLYQWIIIGIIILGIILFMKQFQQIKRKNKSILKNKKELSKALKSNQILLKEIHHRIKNNLQIISGILELKSSKLIGKKSIAVFLETQKYIESMTFIHEHLYAQDSRSVLEMQGYLENLTNAILINYSTKSIELDISATNIVMIAENATPLGLIVCELVTNSAKHAFDKSGKIKITISVEEDVYFFHYADNGKGYTIKSKPKPGQIGVNLMDMLIEELDGKGEKYIDNGFHAKIKFK